MLNELLLIERGLTQHGFAVAETHPDVNSVRQVAPVRIRLGDGGTINRVEITEKSLFSAWTVRDGKHNSFPYLKLGRPILSLPTDKGWKKAEASAWKRLSDAAAKRAALARLSREYPVDETWAAGWPGQGLQTRVSERYKQLVKLDSGASRSVPAAFGRFLAALRRQPPFLLAVCARLNEARREDDEAWITAARKLLVEGGSFYVDVDDLEFDRDAGDIANLPAVSQALIGDATSPQAKACSLTGARVPLHRGNFPQPNLPSLGPTYLFAKNKDTPAAHRYGRFAAAAFDVGAELTKRLSGGLEELTVDYRRGKTWQRIPSERPKKKGKPSELDLLLAFLPGDLTAPIATVVAENAQATYENSSESALADLDGRVRHSTPQDVVQLCVLRKLDKANRKAIFHRSLTLRTLHEQAMRWRSGTANHPPTIKMLIPGKKGEKAEIQPPPHVMPTEIPALTRKQFLEDGNRATELTGATSVDAFALFLDEGDVCQRARTLLRIVIQRHAPLLAGVTHAKRRREAQSEGVRDRYQEHWRRFDRVTALKSIALIGILLHKAEHRTKEAYMHDSAFRLGQLLAFADLLHVSYCVDCRDGQIPPSLLGNSVLSTAQTSPFKALALLSLRLVPYLAWASQQHALGVLRLKEVDAEGENQGSGSGEAVQKGKPYGWVIPLAMAEGSGVRAIAAGLSGKLQERADDVFRAELLLGYVAGIPPRDKTTDPNATSSTKK